MHYYSISNPNIQSSFREATLEGQPMGGGLYFPDQIPLWDSSFIQALPQLSKAEIGFRIMQPYVGGTLSDDVLFSIMEDVLSFDFPLKKINVNTWCLELFHGPTLAFKDLGARFLSRVMGHFATAGQRKIVVLVATSGDTGGAVADAFHGVEGTEVIILYPSGKVSPVQEKQLTTLGGNIHALEVLGDFDDCQRLVKQAFQDEKLKSGILLTSSNSINISRWLSQQVYYALALAQWPEDNAPVIAVPSGNFGNICAGLVAQQSGLPVKHFIAACNANNVFTNYLDTAIYQPKHAVATISNAMDVGNPSNFERILQLFNKDHGAVKKLVSSASISDADTEITISSMAKEQGYIMDPHTAVAYNALGKWRQKNGDHAGIILGTAHPVKFPDVVERVTGTPISIPEAVAGIMEKDKLSTTIKPDYQSLQEAIQHVKN